MEALSDPSARHLSSETRPQKHTTTGKCHKRTQYGLKLCTNRIGISSDAPSSFHHHVIKAARMHGESVVRTKSRDKTFKRSLRNVLTKPADLVPRGPRIRHPTAVDRRQQQWPHRTALRRLDSCNGCTQLAAQSGHRQSLTAWQQPPSFDLPQRHHVQLAREQRHSTGEAAPSARTSCLSRD